MAKRFTNHNIDPTSKGHGFGYRWSDGLVRNFPENPEDKDMSEIRFNAGVSKKNLVEFLDGWRINNKEEGI